MIKQRRSFIIGIKGIKLNKNEIIFLKKYKPWGIILFSRNIKSINQVKKLTDSIKSIFNDENYPISSFSCRGPTQCPGEGSLSTYPEVVAPGQSVRSAWGKNEFNTISGTSMAAPHVSGAVLLLKEAFPFFNLRTSYIFYCFFNQPWSKFFH